MDKDDIKSAISEALKDNRALDPETHKLHHNYVDELIKRRQRRDAMWDKARAQVLVWGIITILTGIGISVYNYVASLMKVSGQGH
mgnify:CR=1 FL=1